MAEEKLTSYNLDFGTGSTTALKYYLRLGLMDYERTSPFDTFDGKVNTWIMLPLPQELRDDTFITYSNIEMGAIGDILNAGASQNAAEGIAGAALLRNSGGLAKSGVDAIVGGISAVAGDGGVGGAISGGAQSLANAINEDQITTAIQQYFGVAPNPNPSVAFQGPKLRDFNFSWTFMPTTLQDSRNLRKVINKLKASALPGHSLKGNSAILNYPKMVRINFFPWDSGGSGKYSWSDKSIIRIKHCFMSSVNVNYTNGNVPAFFAEGSNEPVSISMSINFTEVEYMLARDFDGSYDESASDGFSSFLSEQTSELARDISNAANNLVGTTDSLFDVVTGALTSSES